MGDLFAIIVVAGFGFVAGMGGGAGYAWFLAKKLPEIDKRMDRLEASFPTEDQPPTTEMCRQCGKEVGSCSTDFDPCPWVVDPNLSVRP